MIRDRTCPSCRVIGSADGPRAAAGCVACGAGRGSALAIELAPGRAVTARLAMSPAGDPGWLLAPLLGMLALALGLLAVSHVAAFLVWAAGSAATVGVSAWLARRSGGRPRPRAGALPSAVTLPRRDRSRRKLPGAR